MKTLVIMIDFEEITTVLFKEPCTGLLRTLNAMAKLWVCTVGYNYCTSFCQKHTVN